MSKVILVSAGHSTVPPKDPGAVGSGHVEAQETLKLRDAVAANLRARGLSVLEDGADGISEPLVKAIALAKKAQVAIEFHFNEGPPAATGIEVLSKSNLQPLAKKLASAIHAATGLSLRGTSGWKAEDSGHHSRLGFCEAGGAIVEVAFITNAVDMKAYSDNFDAVVRNVADVLAA
jgi:N-acetylmuramoyl-L-alanine amidase